MADPGPPPADEPLFCSHCPWDGSYGTANVERNLDLGPLRPIYLAHCPECGDLLETGPRHGGEV